MMEQAVPTPTIGDIYALVGWPLWLMLLGGLLGLVSSLWMLVAAFNESLVWGLCVLLVPFAALVFLIARWSAARNPFLLSLFAVGLMFGGVALASGNMTPDSPGMQALMEKYDGQLGAEFAAAVEQRDGVAGGGGGAAEGAGAIPEPTPVRTLTRGELVEMQRELNRVGADLRERKAALDPGDARAKAELTAEIEEYNHRLEEFQTLRESLPGAAGQPARGGD